MKLSPEAAELVALYEQEYNRKPTERGLQIALYIDKVGNALRERGRKEAQEGKEAYPADVFTVMVAKAFRLDPTKDAETVQVLADLWRDDYMDGYNSWKEVRSA